MKTETKTVEENKKPVLDSRNLPAPIKRRRYYTPNEVKLHNSANDCWVSIFHEVYDLTELIQLNYGLLTDPIVQAGGSDITHWFDNTTKDVKLDVKSAKSLYYKRN